MKQLKSSNEIKQEKIKLAMDVIVSIAIRILEQKGKKETVIK